MTGLEDLPLNPFADQVAPNMDLLRPTDAYSATYQLDRPIITFESSNRPVWLTVLTEVQKLPQEKNLPSRTS